MLPATDLQRPVQHADRGAQMNRVDRTIKTGCHKSAETPHDRRMTALCDGVLLVRCGS